MIQDAQKVYHVEQRLTVPENTAEKRMSDIPQAPLI